MFETPLPWVKGCIASGGIESPSSKGKTVQIHCMSSHEYERAGIKKNYRNHITSKINSPLYLEPDLYLTPSKVQCCQEDVLYKQAQKYIQNVYCPGKTSHHPLFSHSQSIHQMRGINGQEVKQESTGTRPNSQSDLTPRHCQKPEFLRTTQGTGLSPAASKTILLLP